MSQLGILVPTLVGTLVGAGVGYGLRIREWQREKRLLAYTEFSQAFLLVGRKFVVMFKSQPGSDERKEAVDEFAVAWERFGSSRAQTELLATSRTYEAAIACNEFVSNEIWTRVWADADHVDVAPQDASHLQWSALAFEFRFLAAASRELGPRLFAQRKARHLESSARELIAVLSGQQPRAKSGEDG